LVNNLVGGVTTQVGRLTDAVTWTLANNDLHTNDTFDGATALQQQIAQANSRLDYAFRGSISDNTDVDFYRVTAPPAVPGASEVLTISLWGLPSLFASSAAAPRVLVYDAQRQLVTAQVLVNDGFTYAVQVANAVPGAAYYVEVIPSVVNGQTNLGNYFLGVDFAAQAAQLANLTSGSFGDAGQSAGGT